MEINPDQLAAQISSGGLKPIYLIAGDEPLRVIEACDAVRAAAREAGCSEREVFEIAGKDAREKKNDDAPSIWKDIGYSVNSPSLFSPMRLIEIRMPTGKPGVEGAKFLESLASDPPPGVIVMIIADEWSKKHGGKWSQAVSSKGVISIAYEVRSNELVRWLGNRARTRNVKLTSDALQLIADRVDGNLLAAAQEIDKLALLNVSGEAAMNADDLRAHIADMARFDVFRLIDASWNGNGALASRTLNGLRQEGAVVPALMGMIVSDLKTTLMIAERTRGADHAGAMKSMYVPSFKQAMYLRALQRHPAARWNRFLFEAGRIDRASKGRESGDAWLHLERLLVAIAEPAALNMLKTARA